MNKLNLFILLAILLSNQEIINCQFSNELPAKERYLRIMFYNVENLFDTQDDSLTNDNEFLPDEGKFWNYHRYQEKLHHISTVIASIGGWNPPEIIGLAEIENRKVLDDLCKRSELSKLEYNIIHQESHDPRGIDVAFLYRKKYFKPLSYKAIRVLFPFSPNSYTRDILYVCGKTNINDTLHVFINHWPSRWGGQLDSERNRMEAARTLRVEVDSIFKTNCNSKIIIMGDFNDYPENRSLSDVLKANRTFDNIIDNELYNLSAYIAQTKDIGSHKFEGVWGILDQTIVSGALLNAKKGLSAKKENAYIYNPDFLLTDDENYTGKTNFRTYNGYKYIGGYSDHLPVFIDLDYLK
jgi:predicted extracellular nuclease